MNKEELKNITRHVFNFYDKNSSNCNWTDMNEAYGEILKILEQKTVSKEVYNQLVFKAYKLDRIFEQADLALGDIKVTLRSPNRDDMVDKIEKIVNKYDENVMEFLDFIAQKRDKSDEDV